LPFYHLLDREAIHTSAGEFGGLGVVFTTKTLVVRKNPFMVRQAHHERDGAM